MKSIREKANEYADEQDLRMAYNGSCDNCQQGFVLGANYVLEEVARIQLYTQSNVLKQVLDYIDKVQKEPVSDDLEEASKEWLKPQLDKSYADYGETKMMELTHFDGYAMLDAIEFGAKWQREQINEALLSEVLPCFMHGGEADEVVAKLDEVLNQKK